MMPEQVSNQPPEPLKRRTMSGEGTGFILGEISYRQGRRLGCSRSYTPSASALRATAERSAEPDGQISELAVQPLLQKYFRSRQTQITTISLAVPSHRGALAIVTD